MHISYFYPGTKLNFNVEGITNHSKKVLKNYIFISTNKNKKYINEAINNGAILIIAKKHTINKKFLYNKNPKLEYIRLLQIFHGYKNNIYTVGITGTNGKTTTSYLLNSVFNSLDQSCYIGTNGIKYLNKTIETINTTPSPDIIYSVYQALNKQNINNLVMEVSSEGLLDDRVANLGFNGAIFTNLSHEHLNTHKNMNNYFLCKTKLFKSLKHDGLLVANADDDYTYRIAFYTKAKVITYGFRYGDYQVKGYKMNLAGSSFNVLYKGKSIGVFNTRLFGKYNIYNVLAVIAYTYELGIPIDIIKKGIENIAEVDGRFMQYEHNDVNYIIDYAHTPDALKCLLENVKKIADGKIILITGAAGEKDYSKRSKMGIIATAYADTTIFTSEDPKNESLFKIFSDLTKGIKDSDYYLTLSRESAIKLAVKIAKPHDIVLITGKGNEKTEKIKDYVFKKCDMDILKEALDA